MPLSTLLDIVENEIKSMRNDPSLIASRSTDPLEAAPNYPCPSTSASHDWSSMVLLDAFNEYLAPYLFGCDGRAVRTVCRSWKRINYAPECIFITEKTIRRLASHRLDRAVSFENDQDDAVSAAEEELFNRLCGTEELRGLCVSGVTLPASTVQTLKRRLRGNSVSLKSLELRNTYDESQANFGKVFRSLALNTTLTRLVLKDCNRFDLEALADALQVNTTLRHLRIEQFELDSSLFNALKANTSLQSLALKPDYNDIQDDHVYSLFQSVGKNRGLTHVEFHLQERGYQGIRSGLSSLAASGNTSLTSLDLTYGRSNDDIVDTMLFRLDFLRRFRFEAHGNEFGDIGKSLVKQLCYLDENKLQKFMLDSIDMGRRALDVLSDFVFDTTALEVLSLRDCYMELRVDSPLTAALCENKTITEIDLTRNHLSSSCFKALAEILKTNITISRVVLSENSANDPDCVAALSDALSINSTLKELGLANTTLGDVEMIHLCNAIKINVGLSSLDLSCNEIGDHGAHALAEALSVNVTLFTVNLKHNRITEAAIDYLHKQFFGFIIRPLILDVAGQRAAGAVDEDESGEDSDY